MRDVVENAHRRSVATAPAIHNKAGESVRHGGASTGARTLDGVERCRQARWKDGHRSGAAKAARQSEGGRTPRMSRVTLYCCGLIATNHEATIGPCGPRPRPPGVIAGCVPAAGAGAGP